VDRRNLIVGTALLVVMAAFVGTVAAIRSSRKPAVAPLAPVADTPKPKSLQQEPPTPADEPEIQNPRPAVEPEKQGVALHDATLLGLIQNAKVAQQRGDMTTRDAMLAGLKKQPERSRLLLSREIQTSQDRHVAYALEALMRELQ
jgi:hypothetical protein